MNTTIRTLATAAILTAAALGLAGTAAATTSTTTNTTPEGPGYSYSPGTYATPAPTVGPGWHNNHGPAYIAHLNGK
jgi:hypothetical protein